MSGPIVIDSTCNCDSAAQHADVDHPVECLNCGWTGFARYSWGHKFQSGVLGDPCVLCGCKDLIRSGPAVATNSMGKEA